MSKPHLIILSQPAQEYLSSGLLRNRHSKGYTFIVHMPASDPSLDLSHLVPLLIWPARWILACMGGWLDERVGQAPQEALFGLISVDRWPGR